MATDLTLADRLEFSNGALLSAVIGDPVVTTSIEHANILEVTLRDTDGTLLANLSAATTATVDGFTFKLARVEKQATRLTLTFEDKLIASLRARSTRLSLKAGAMTLSQYAARLTADAGVKLTADPKAASKPNRVLGRSVGTTETSSWQMLADIAAREGWRLFSDGTRILLGSDAWLLGRKAPRTVYEHVDPLVVAGFKIDSGRAIDHANLTVKTAQWTTDVGGVIALSNLGAADGNWLVSSWTRSLLDESQSTVLLQRPSTGL